MTNNDSNSNSNSNNDNDSNSNNNNDNDNNDDNVNDNNSNNNNDNDNDNDHDLKIYHTLKRKLQIWSKLTGWQEKEDNKAYLARGEHPEKQIYPRVSHT